MRNKLCFMSTKDTDFHITLPLDVFMAEGVHPRGKVSILEPFADQIDEALAKRLSYKQIVEWLARNGVTISKQSLNQWVHRRAARAKASSSASNPISNQARRSTDIVAPALFAGVEKTTGSTPVPSEKLVLKRTVLPKVVAPAAAESQKADKAESKRLHAIKVLTEGAAEAREQDRGVNLNDYKSSSTS